jgi:hypothetical protein
VLIQIAHSAPSTHRVQLHPELYQRALVVLPVDSQKWWLLDQFDGSIPAGRMRKIRRGSVYFQLQPLQRTTTSWEVGTGWTIRGARWVRIEVSSDPQSPKSVSVDIIPIYDCDRISKIGFEISNFDFRTRIAHEEFLTLSQNQAQSQTIKRISRYHRTPVI